jgi:hypothetical protein
VIIAVQKLPTAGDKNSAEAVATVIVGKKPFTQTQISAVKKVADDLGFELLYTPDRSADPDLPRLLSGQGDRAVIANFPANIAAPTDDSPYFFQMSRLMWGRGSEKRLSSGMMPLDDASRVLGNLLLMVTVLTLVLVIFPMVQKSRNVNFFRSVPFLIFAGIGMGYDDGNRPVRG